MVAELLWSRTKILDVDLAVVLGHVHRRVLVHALGLGPVGAPVRDQGLEVRAVVAPGLAIVPSPRASLVPVRQENRDRSPGRVPKVIGTVPSRVESPRIGIAPSPVTSREIVRRVEAEIVKCQSPDLVQSHRSNPSRVPDRVQSLVHAPSRGTSPVHDQLRVPRPGRAVAVVVAALVEMIEMWTWKMATVAARNTTLVTSKTCMDSGVFLRYPSSWNRDGNKVKIIFMGRFLHTSSYCSLDVIFTPISSIFSTWNHYSSLFSDIADCIPPVP